VGTPGAHLEEPRSQSAISVSGGAVRFDLRLASPASSCGSSFEPTPDRRLPPLPAQPSCSALCLRFEPAFVAIHHIPAPGSSTVPLSGTASRLVSSFRLRSTVAPRLQLRGSLHRRLSLQFCCPVRLFGLAPSSRTFRPCHPLCCQLAPPTELPVLLSCAPPDSRRSIRLRASPSVVAVSFRCWLPWGFCFVAALRLAPSFNRSASRSTLPVSLRRQQRFRICLPAPALDLRRSPEPFSLAFGSVFSLRRCGNLQLLPSCLSF
jgi:hypothetical protein